VRTSVHKSVWKFQQTTNKFAEHETFATNVVAFCYKVHIEKQKIIDKLLVPFSYSQEKEKPQSETANFYTIFSIASKDDVFDATDVSLSYEANVSCISFFQALMYVPTQCLR
jgi:hypothetical protein